MFVQLSPYFNFYLTLPFSFGDLYSYFLWLVYCKSDVKLARWETVVEKTVVEEKQLKDQ